MQDLIWHPQQDRIFIKKIYNSSGDVVQRIVYVNENTVKIKNSSGTHNFYYIYQGDTLVARKNADGTTYYYHPDHLGSTSLIQHITPEQFKMIRYYGAYCRNQRRNYLPYFK